MEGLKDPVILRGDPIQLRWHIFQAVFDAGDDVEALIELLAWVRTRCKDEGNRGEMDE